MVSRIHVLHVVRQFHPAVGGLEEVVLNLARQQRRALDIDARVLTLNRMFSQREHRLPGAEIVDGIPIERIGFVGSTRYPLAPGILRRLDKCDLIHVHALDFFYDFLAVTRWLHRKPLVVSTHGGFFHTDTHAKLKRLWFRTLTPLSARAYQAIVAVSDSDAALFRRVAGSKLAIIENGVDLDKFTGPPASGGRDPHRLISIGRLTRHKRLDRAIDLLAALRGRQPGWSLVIAGAPAEQSEGELRAYAQTRGVGDAVRILLSPDAATLAEEASQATYFISASEYEGFGVAAVEAAAAGLIPVLSDIPAFRRLRERLGAGLTFDPAALESAASHLLANGMTDHASDAEHNLRERASAFGWPLAAAGYAEIYRKVLAICRGAAGAESTSTVSTAAIRSSLPAVDYTRGRGA